MTIIELERRPKIIVKPSDSQNGFVKVRGKSAAIVVAEVATIGLNLIRVAWVIESMIPFPSLLA